MALMVLILKSKKKKKKTYDGMLRVLKNTHH